jgi:hypothetical protein
MKAIDGITVEVRTSGVWLHLKAAERAAKRCQVLDEQYRDFATDGALTELRQQCVVSVMMSAAAVEAFGNELLFDKEKGFAGLNYKQQQADLKHYVTQHSRKSLNTAGPLKVCDGYLRKGMHAGLDIKKRGSVDEEAHALFRARNAFVHYWPEWSGQTVLHAEVGALLAGRFSDGPQKLPPNSGLFPDRCLGFGSARWAVRSAIAFIRSMESRAGLSPNYSQERVPLDPDLL